MGFGDKGDCLIHTTMYSTDYYWEATVEPREPYSVLCGDLNGKEIQGRRDICIHVSDSPCRTAGVNSTVKQRHYPQKYFFSVWLLCSFLLKMTAFSLHVGGQARLFLNLQTVPLVLQDNTWTVGWGESQIWVVGDHRNQLPFTSWFCSNFPHQGLLKMKAAHTLLHALSSYQR